MNNENNDTILPIGTVLRTKTGEVPLMVVNRAALYEENGELGYFDYAAVVYPEGLNDDNEFVFFNREDVAEVYFFGYINADEQLFEEQYDDLVKESGYKKLSL